jgi:hypothetical protein
MTSLEQDLLGALLIFMLGFVPVVPRLARLAFLWWGLFAAAGALVGLRAVPSHGTTEALQYLSMLRGLAIIPLGIHVARELWRRFIGVQAMEH